MPNRNFPSHTPQPSPKFGLVGWLEQTRVQLPLKGVECQFHVCGDLLSVEIDQIFHQDNAQAMDCLYSFPPARRSRGLSLRNARQRPRHPRQG